MDGLRDALPVVLAAVAALLVGGIVTTSRIINGGSKPADTTTDDWRPQPMPDLGPFPLPEQPGPVQTEQGSAPRGIRNNNPGNIRWDGQTQWRGMVAADPAGFVIFDTPENGIRAMARILNTYAGRGVITLQQIISTWAPTSENNTAAYVDHLAGRLGQSPNEPVNDRAGLIAGIILHENGQQPYSATTIAEGIARA